uniref:Putative secreted protein n=1 Tax=Ixodes ricinus TaxID=34613 RepID=A0A6B0U3E2_IXORI
MPAMRRAVAILIVLVLLQGICDCQRPKGVWRPRNKCNETVCSPKHFFNIYISFLLKRLPHFTCNHTQYHGVTTS